MDFKPRIAPLALEILTDWLITYDWLSAACTTIYRTIATRIFIVLMNLVVWKWHNFLNLTHIEADEEEKEGKTKSKNEMKWEFLFLLPWMHKQRNFIFGNKGVMSIFGVNLKDFLLALLISQCHQTIASTWRCRLNSASFFSFFFHFDAYRRFCVAVLNLSGKLKEIASELDCTDNENVANRAIELFPVSVW